ncbi:MAG: DegT/DnrJ/EryC1/StrS aminotransferase family protein [Legionellaceae bacterium]|nr:DegT/DnrJ/EryC1/StrS aminotransferase family protein [Legionellaceae bacterium]
MLNTLYSPWPNFTEEEAGAVKEVLLSNRVNAWTGKACQTFEKAFSEWAGTTHAIAVMNGTVALELALKGLGIGPGDEVVVTPRSFMASVSCIVSVGATPVFADVSLDTQNITAESIQAVLSEKTRAVICVHLAGWPCEMDDIMALSQKHDLFIIEDCAQAHGAKYKRKPVGSIGHVAAWSFCQDKIMTTGGEGGMVTTNDKALWSRMWSYKEHGKSWNAVFGSQKKEGFQWVCEHFGTNLRMTEMQATIGSIQLKRMPKWHARRLEHAKKIWAVARKLPGVRVPDLPQHIEHAAYKAYVFLQPEELKDGWNQARVLSTMQARGVPCYVGSCSEIYQEKAFDNTGFRPEKRLPNAKKMGETSLMFLVHPTLTEDEMNHTCHVLQETMLLATQQETLSQRLPA